MNPLVSQGVLNRLRGSVALLDYPQLNVTASYLTKAGITLALEGDASAYIATMTGAVPSPEPYMMASCTVHLVKSNSFADLWKQQMELMSNIGDMTVTPDASTLSPYPLLNCTIRNVAEQSFAGEDPAYAVTIGGTYLINASMFTS